MTKPTGYRMDIPPWHNETLEQIDAQMEEARNKSFRKGTERRQSEDGDEALPESLPVERGELPSD